ncbi:MAG: GDP-mannose 4,6-dehydratase [Gemmatimonadaceae bacterium]|nr:GDP-mannose 4,6-dehydratase [Gemmatimonadaceae bacterium]
MRALVTGAAGFVGGWLLRALRAEGYHVTALSLTPPANDAPVDAHVTWMWGDLRDDAFVGSVVDAAAPDVVVHLAAISHLPTAAADPAFAWDVNVTATVRLLHHLDRWRTAAARDPLVLVIGSAEQYGRHEAMPLREDAVLAPRTVYAATKVAQEVLALQTWRASGLRVVGARSFNHSGRGQDARFLLPALVRRALALRSAPQGTPLLVGNTTPVRDFLHVHDVVSAYIALLQHGVPGEVYNVASGTGRSVLEVIEHVLARVGVQASIATDPSLVRPVDVPALVGDPSKLHAATGWRASRAFDDIIDDIIDDVIHAATH